MSEEKKNSPINVSELDSKFKYEVSEQPGGENLTLCFSCGICTAGCPVTEVEGEYISNVLASAGGNKTHAAEILGIDRKTLREKLKKVE